jgi:hypothetical protein
VSTTRPLAWITTLSGERVPAPHRRPQRRGEAVEDAEDGLERQQLVTTDEGAEPNDRRERMRVRPARRSWNGRVGQVMLLSGSSPSGRATGS